MLMFLFIATLGILSGCSSDTAGGENYFGIEKLNKSKAKDILIQDILDSNVIKNNGVDYGKSDIEIVKLCEAYNILETKDEFTGRFQVFWKTTDGDIEEYIQLTQNYTTEKVANHEAIADRCITDL